ncbi:MAG: transcription elongation factor GreA, partial [Bacteroidetes bacterium]|nr:transcription elongation factor GreA [Bacteroidota bacterium]
MSGVTYYSKEGLEKLKEELHGLKTVNRPFISKQIADARDKGDLSENAEYHAAREQQSFIEGRIKELTGVLSAAQIVDISSMNG